MRKGFFNLIIAVLIVTLAVAGPLFAVTVVNAAATTATDPAVAECQTYLATAPSSEASNPASKAAQCETLIQLYAQLAQQQAALANQQGVSGNLSSDIKNLTAQITEKQTEIKAKVAHIAVLSDSISTNESTIQSLSAKVDDEKDSLAQLLRETNEMDQATLTTFLFSGETLADFYSDQNRYETLKADVKSSVDSIQAIEGVTEQNEQELQTEQNQTVDEQQALVETQNQLAQQQSTQKTLLSASKSKEATYQQIIAAQQAKVAQIKAKLFALAGGGQAIPFGTALEYADEAQAKTGIDPAFLLAELTQESNLGANVGKCYLTDTTTGAGTNVAGTATFPNVMKPSRDVQPFIAITTALGYNWQNTVVSCPIAGVVGYGGAMGPAQFIASTWELFVPRLTTDLGHTPNPWLPEDSFMAASLYLTDLGGVGSSASAQLRASCKYYGSGGATCSYGRNVQALKLTIQSNIDTINQYNAGQ